MDPHPLIQELPANIGAALAIVPALEWAKRSPLVSWITEENARLWSVVIAAAAAVGIHGAYDPTAGTLVVAGVTPVGLVHLIIEIGKQWLGQHWAYKLYQTADTFKSLAKVLAQRDGVPTPSVTGASATTAPPSPAPPTVLQPLNLRGEKL